MEATSGHLYVIKSEEGPVKIGISTDPKKRIANISSGSGRSIVRTYISPLLPEVANLERALHQHFKEHRTVGEWFDISFDDAVMAARITGAMQAPGQWRTSKDYMRGAIYRDRMRTFSSPDRSAAEWEAFFAGLGKDERALADLADQVDAQTVLAGAADLDKRIAKLGMIDMPITQDLIELAAMLAEDLAEAGLKLS